MGGSEKQNMKHEERIHKIKREITTNNARNQYLLWVSNLGENQTDILINHLCAILQVHLLPR